MGERIDREMGGRLFDLATAHRDKGELDEALVILDRIAQSFPELAAIQVQRGAILHDMQRFDQAIAGFDAAFALDPANIEAQIGRGAALQAQGKLEEALAAYESALTIEPHHVRALNNRALVLRGLGRVSEALRSYDEAIALKPDWPDSRFGKAMCLLLLGRFQEGRRLYEWRAGYVERVAPPPRGVPLWRGENLSGKRLLIQAEQGLGDTIQFCRFAATAERQGAQVILQVQESLTDLMQSLPFPVTVIGAQMALPPCDYRIMLLSMPLHCDGADAAPVPYLSAELARVELWRARIGTHGLKIGICWQVGRIGSGKKLDDGGRSFPLRLLEDIACLPQVRLISLQKNEGVEQLGGLPPGMIVETLGEDFDAGAQSFLDSAAVMENLDLVISADTAMAHLAGALGRPVWLALKYAPDWRWLLERDDTPWYPSMRLFRQTAPGDWTSVFKRMEAALRHDLVAGRVDFET